MTDKKILLLLGGGVTVAEKLNRENQIPGRRISASAVWNWMQKDRIPTRFRLPVKRIAEAEGLELGNEFLMEDAA